MPDQLKHWNGEVIMLSGRNAALNTTLEDVSERSTLINWATQAATAAKVQISCASAADKGTPTASTGARKVMLIGLDAHYKLQTEELTTDGQAYVESTKTFIRVFAAEVTLCGTGLTNAGIIYVIVTGTGGTLTAGVPATLTSCWCIIPVGFGYATSGIYTVPAGERVRLERLHLSCRTQQGDFVIASQMPLSTIDNSLHIEDTFSFGAPNAMDFVYPLPTSMIYDEKTDLYMRASSATAAGVLSATLFLRKVGAAQRGGQGVVAPQ